MLKALLKKQFWETLSSQLSVAEKKKANAKKKTRSPKKALGIWIFLTILMWVCFSPLGALMATGLFTDEIQELLTFIPNPKASYFSLFVILGLFFGLLGSAMTTYTTLYKAKDNDFLLSMPIPPKNILFTRMSVVFVITLIYVSWGTVPGLVFFWIYGQGSLIQIPLGILMMVLLALFATALSSVLAAGIAFVASHVRNTTLIKVLVAVAAMGLYFYFYTNLITNTSDKEIFAGIEKLFASSPLLLFIGDAFAGNILNFLACLGVTAVVFGLMFWFLSVKFVDFTTKEKQMKKAEYSEKQVVTASPRKSLLNREFRHIFSNANIILNCCMPAILILIGCVLLLIKAGDIRENLMYTALELEEGVTLPIFSAMLAPILCMLIGMNTYSSASVSLEGRSIWQIKTMPVRSEDILRAKLMCHLLVAIPPVVLLSVVAAIVLEIHPVLWLIGTIVAMMFGVFMAEAGLVLNLKYPVLDWTNEMIPVKNSKPVMILMLPMVLGGPVLIGICIAIGVLFGFLGLPFLGALISELLLLIISGFLVFLMTRWLKLHGAAKWDAIS